MQLIPDVEMICRLVEDEQLGLLYETAREHDALLFTARELVETALGRIRHADALKCGAHEGTIRLRVVLKALLIGGTSHEGDLFDREVEINTVELPHDTDLLCRRTQRNLRDGRAVHQDLSFLYAVDAVEMLE